MKKIFLTSGIVLCMACPAFAAVNDGVANIAGNANSANCVIGTLETSAPGSTANFTALWTPHEGEVDLDSSYTRTNNCNSTVTYADADTAATPDPLYTKYGTGVYGESTRTTAITQLTQPPVLAGYTFGGYYAANDTDFSGTQYIDDNGNIAASVKNLPVNDGDSVTLKAKWTPVSHTITYACGTQAQMEAQDHPSTVSGFTQSETVLHDDCYELIAGASQCQWEGHTFTGWSCTNGVSAAGGKYTVDNDTVCTAQWSENTINLTWTVDGQTYNTGNPSTSCVYSTAIQTLPTKPTKTGYDFAGWDVTSVTPAGSAQP